MVPVDQQLDCSGLSCPMPIVKISRAMKTLAAGQRLEVRASDEAFSADLEAWLSTRSDKLISFQDAGGEQRAVIERGA